jgi:hypothetical protein
LGRGYERLNLSFELSLSLSAVLRDYIRHIVDDNGRVSSFEHIVETAFGKLEATSKPSASLHVMDEGKGSHEVRVKIY